MKKNFKINVTTTGRGFTRLNFKDMNDEACSLQLSSLATQQCIWLGINDANPQIMVSDALMINKQGGHIPIPENQVTGWMSFPLPNQVKFSTRMHLTKEQARYIGTKLLVFAETGDLL